MGSPQVVDFGKNMQYSPDGKMYRIGHVVNIPSKFISADGRTMWVCYVANWNIHRP